MIEYSKNPTFCSRFIYYRNDKVIPRYLDRVANEFQHRTQNITEYKLKYMGHKKNIFNFSLVDKADNEITSCLVDRNIDFMDSSSFKFITHKARQTKVTERASDLQSILEYLIEKSLLLRRKSN